MGEKWSTGAQDLVVEVLSPGTAKYDHQQKYQVYQQHGTGECRIIDPLHAVTEVWTLDDDKLFKRQGVYADDDTFKSVTLNEDVSVKAIFTA